MKTPETDPQFDALLDFLKHSRGFDFSGYKRSSLGRRLAKRMCEVGIQEYADYVEYIEVHPDEFVCLFNTILINVTSFFRDTEAWEFLRQDTIPKIIRNAEPEGHIRIWSVGCSSGQEAYSLAIAFAEAMGPDRYRQKVKIYATDVDEEALRQARQAAYTLKELEGVSPELRSRYFEQNGNTFTFRNDLRRSIIFGHNDVHQHAPISRLDLLVCRNTLMYFNAEAQSRILARFHFALKDTGFLFLGRAEMLLTHAHLFTPISLRHRFFSKARRAALRDQILLLNPAGDPEAAPTVKQYEVLREEVS